MATKKPTTETKVVPSVIKRPRITEKAANNAQHACYLFDIAPNTTKNEVAKAFFATYKQKPIKVNIVNVKPKSFFRRGVLGFAKKSKKAYVFLKKGTTIDIM